MTEVTTEETGVTDYSSMHWKQLKQLMEAEGQEWTDTKTAIDFLTALDKEVLGEATGVESEQPVNDVTEEKLPESSETGTETEEEQEWALGPTMTPERVPVFDKSKPFGTVHGISNAAYFQDGNYFDGVGNYLGEIE